MINKNNNKTKPTKNDHKLLLINIEVKLLIEFILPKIKKFKSPIFKNFQLLAKNLFLSKIKIKIKLKFN